MRKIIYYLSLIIFGLFILSFVTMLLIGLIDIYYKGLSLFALLESFVFILLVGGIALWILPTVYTIIQREKERF